MELEYKKRLLTELLFAAVAGVLIYVGVKFLFGALFPVVVAAVIAYFADKIAEKIYNKIKLPKKLASVATVIVIFALVLGAALGIFYLLSYIFRRNYSELWHLTENATDTLGQVKKKITEIFGEFSPTLANEVEILGENLINTVRSKLLSLFSSLAAGIVKKLPSFSLGVVITLVAACYIAKDFSRLKAFIKELIGDRIYGNILKIKDILYCNVFKMLKGYLLLSFLTFLELTVGFFLLRMRQAVLLALLVSFVDLLPVLGTGAVLIPWSVFKIFSGDAKMGIFLLILYLIVALVRNFAEPKIIGNQIGINPLFTLIAMFAGLRLWGFWGLIICPLTLIVVIKFYENRLDKNEG